MLSKNGNATSTVSNQFRHACETDWMSVGAHHVRLFGYRSRHSSVNLPETAASRTASRNFFRICGTRSSRARQEPIFATISSSLFAIASC